MLIIDDQVLLIHMRRAGGTTLCTGLINLLKNDVPLDYLGYNRPDEPRGSPEFLAGAGANLAGHATAYEIKCAIGTERFDKLEKWLVSDRPLWERIASMYCYCKRRHKENPSQYPFIKDMSFPKYLRSRWGLKDTKYNYGCDPNGYWIVDRVVSYYALQGEFASLAKRWNKNIVALPIINMNHDRTDYRMLYGADDWEYIEQRGMTA
jgi:hypothetical protein